MGKRMSVVEVESGRIFKNMSEAERELNLSYGSVSYSVKEGKPVKGHRFELIDPDEVVVSQDSTQVAGKVLQVPESTLEMTVDDKRAFADQFRAQGYDCEYLDMDGSVVFFNVHGDDVESRIREIVEDSGYHSCWGMTGYSKDKFIHIISH